MDCRRALEMPAPGAVHAQAHPSGPTAAVPGRSPAVRARSSVRHDSGCRLRDLGRRTVARCTLPNTQILVERALDMKVARTLDAGGEEVCTAPTLRQRAAQAGGQ